MHKESRIHVSLQEGQAQLVVNGPLRLLRKLVQAIRGIQVEVPCQDVKRSSSIVDSREVAGSDD